MRKKYKTACNFQVSSGFFKGRIKIQIRFFSSVGVEFALDYFYGILVKMLMQISS